MERRVPFGMRKVNIAEVLATSTCDSDLMLSPWDSLVVVHEPPMRFLISSGPSFIGENNSGN